MSETWHNSYDLGKRAFNEGDYEEALKHLQEVLKEKVTYADVYNMLGVIAATKDQNKEAVDFLKKALALNPRYTEAGLNLSVVYNNMGDFDKAQAIYGNAKSITGSISGSYLDDNVKNQLSNMHSEIGHLYKTIGMYEDAASEFVKALALRPDFLDIKAQLGIVYREMKEFDKSVMELEGAILLNPDFSPARTNLGLTYYVMGRLEMAKDEWSKSLKINPNDTIANMYMHMLEKKV